MTVKQHEQQDRHAGTGVERGDFLESRRKRDAEPGRR
nr:hypothetical protein [Tanacetum cinerariifolium]